MRPNLFWLGDEQWSGIEPLLPTDVRGKDRVDDRRVISSILQVIKSDCRWATQDDDLEPCPETVAPPRAMSRWWFRLFAVRFRS